MSKHQHQQNLPFSRWICAQIRLILIVILTILIIRHFLIEVFKVSSPSMEPALIGDLGCGDYLVVNKAAYIWKEPKRWDIVAFRHPLNQRRIFVKRLVGLPGEEISIKNGNIYIEKKIVRKPHDVQEAMEHLVFDSKIQSISEFWQPILSPDSPEDRIQVELGAEARACITTTTSASLRYQEEILDQYEPYEDNLFWKRTYYPTVKSGQNRVGEIRLHIEATALHAGSIFSEIRVGSRRFYLVLPVTQQKNLSSNSPITSHPAPPSSQQKIHNSTTMNEAAHPLKSQLSLYRGEKQIPDFTWQSPITLQSGHPHVITLCNYDEQIVIRVDSNLIFCYDYADLLDKSPNATYDLEIYVGGTNGTFLFSDLKIFRDIYYISRHNLWAGAESWKIPHDSYFVLGDNSSNSYDSRDWKKFCIPLHNGKTIEGDQQYPPRRKNEQYIFTDAYGITQSIPSTAIKNGIIPSVEAPYVSRYHIIGQTWLVAWPPPRGKTIH